MRFQAILLALGLLLVSSDVVPSSARAAGCKQENVKKFFKKTDKWCSTEYAKNISAMTTRGQGDHTVRAEQDPLMFKFDDGTELALQVDTDTSSRRIGMGTSEGFCGFYNITKEQLQSVGTKKVVEVVKFFDPEKEKSGPRLEQTEDGRTFYRWALTLKKNQEELADQAACVLTF